MYIKTMTTAGALALAAGLLVAPLDATDWKRPSFEVIASGLDNPRGLAFGPDRALYVAEAGRGGNGKCITNGAGATVCFGNTGAITRIGDERTRRSAQEASSRLSRCWGGLVLARGCSGRRGAPSRTGAGGQCAGARSCERVGAQAGR